MKLGDRHWCFFCRRWLQDWQETNHECSDRLSLGPQRPSRHNVSNPLTNELVWLQDQWDVTHPDEAPCMYG